MSKAKINTIGLRSGMRRSFTFRESARATAPADILRPTAAHGKRTRSNWLPDNSRALAVNVHLPLDEFKALAGDWLADGVCRQHSDNTTSARRFVVDKLLWWLQKEKRDTVGTREIRGFLMYLGSPAPEGGRWGNPNETDDNRPGTVFTYWERLRTLFRWAVEQGVIPVSPIDPIRTPIARNDEIQPFSQAQVRVLLDTAEQSRYPSRDVAICLFLLDTGVRASELCGLNVCDVDIEGMKATVHGKGNKDRPVYLSEPTLEALMKYLREHPKRSDSPLFHGEKGSRLTRSGLQQLVQRLGDKAGIVGARCSPHTFRHTAAIWSLRNGMDLFTLQKMLGHTNLTMTRRYVAIAQADLEQQHRRCSPVRLLTAGPNIASQN